MGYEEGSTVKEETYTTPAGLTAAIVGITSSNGAKTEYHAHFSINGVRYGVSAADYRVGLPPVPEDPAHTLAVLKQVLDSFQ